MDNKNKIAGASLWLRDLARLGARAAGCPEDTVLLASPAMRPQGCRVGVCLYDIQEYGAAGPASFLVRVEAGTLCNPPRALELHYLVYVEEEGAFGSYQADQEQQLLALLAQAFLDRPLPPPQEEMSLSFSMLPLERKTSLWLSFSRPLQPSLYLDLAPVLIESGLTRPANAVRTRQTRLAPIHPQEGGAP